MQSKQEIYDRITSELAQKLEAGVIPWRKSWRTGIPSNFISKRPYNGINFLSLSLTDHPSPYYLSFLQCKDKKGFINKGEKGNIIVYWSIRELKEMSEEGNCSSKRIPLIRYSFVFNLSQTNLFNPESGRDLAIIDCEDIIKGMPIRPIIKHNISRCYYSIDDDYISLPQISDFDIPSEFYSSLFHELIHWTGHPNRLNRFQENDAQTEYSFEELVAEIGSAYLCAQVGISAKVLSNQSSYIDHWLKHLRNDKDIFIKAAHSAQKATMYILNQRYNDVFASE